MSLTGRGSSSNGLGARVGPSLSVAEVVGLALVLVGAPLAVDPFGQAAFLAVKVLLVAVGLLLVWISVAWERSLAVPWGFVS